MANYVAITRSNYFRVLDAKRFERWCRYFNVDFWTEKKLEGQDDIFYAIGNEDGDGWPSSHPETFADIDFEHELRKHLDPRDIAILMQSSHEALRFVGGHAVALHADGRAEHISLNGIYDIARKAFGADVQITEALY